MADSRFFETARTFSPEEQEAFVLFLRSPFFVREETAGELTGIYRCLREQMSAYPEARPDRHALHAAGFPDKPYSDDRLNRALAKLGQLAEQFLLFYEQKTQSNELQQNIRLAGVFRKRNAYELIEKKVREAEKIVERGLEESPENYRLRYELAHEKYCWKALKNKGKGDLGIPYMLHQLRLYYNIESGNFLCHLLAQEQVAAAVKLQNREELISKYSIPEDLLLEQYPLFIIYKKLQELLSSDGIDKQRFYAFKALIEKHEHEISFDLARHFWAYIRNLCSAISNTGDATMQELLFEVILQNLKQGYLYHRGRIPPFTLLNITRSGWAVKNASAITEVVEAHRYKIMVDEEQEEIYKVNLAFCLFAQKKFEEAAECLAFPKTIFIYLLTARRLEVMIHYELQSDLLLYKIDAFRKFVHRISLKEIEAGVRKQNILFANIILQLAQSKIKDRKKSLSLLKQIERPSVLMERSWLREKVKNLG